MILSEAELTEICKKWARCAGFREKIRLDKNGEIIASESEDLCPSTDECVQIASQIGGPHAAEIQRALLDAARE